VAFDFYFYIMTSEDIEIMRLIARRSGARGL